MYLKFRPAWLLLTMLVLQTIISAQTEFEKPSLGISVCWPKITEAGRQSSFQFNYFYRLTTDDDGKIVDVKTILPSEKDKKMFSYFMDDSEVTPCLRKWTMKPAGKYFVNIFVGTTSTPQFLSVSSKTVSIRIDL